MTIYPATPSWSLTFRCILGKQINDRPDSSSSGKLDNQSCMDPQPTQDPQPEKWKLRCTFFSLPSMLWTAMSLNSKVTSGHLDLSEWLAWPGYPWQTATGYLSSRAKPRLAASASYSVAAPPGAERYVCLAKRQEKTRLGWNPKFWESGGCLKP